MLVACADKRGDGGKVAETEPSGEAKAIQGTTAPDGIKGLRFGMSPAEVAAALKVDLGPGDPETVVGAIPDSDRPISADVKSRALTESLLELGPRHAVATEIGGQPAACQLDFIDAGKLTRIRCTISADDTAALEAVLVETLAKKYGPPKEPTFSTKTWSSPTATLEVTNELLHVALDNQSRAHPRLIAEKQKAADAISARIVGEALASQAEDPTGRLREALDKDL